MYKLPNLTYNYDALSRCMSGETMSYHYGKHHQAYVDKLNAALDANPEFKDRTLEDLLCNCATLPESARKPICNNAGGHYNHSLFWLCMSPNGGGEPTGDVANLINNRYGSFQKFVDEFTTKALGVFGSGWVYLQPNGDIITTPNQDTPLSIGLEAPILCLDVWEHAYYLDYKNKRDDFIKSWWSVVDWNSVSERLKTASNDN